MSDYGISWIRQSPLFNSSSNNVWPDVTTDSSGNLYLAYHTVGTVSGGSNTGNFDVIVCKFNASGSLVWVKQTAVMNTTLDDTRVRIVADSAGNVFCTYQSTGVVSGGTNLGSTDIVVFKLDTNGSMVWNKQYASLNSTLGEQLPTIDIDSSGNVYIAYYTAGAVSGGTFLGTNDIAVVKIDTNGNIVWIRQSAILNTTGNDQIPDVAVDSSGNVYITYYTNGVVSSGVNSGSNDIVVMKMNSNGSMVWIKEQAAMNTSVSDTIPNIDIDSSGNVYVVYNTAGTVSGGTFLGSTDTAVFKMDTNGNTVWIKQFASVNTSVGDSTPKIAVDANGNSYISYATPGTVSGGTFMGGTGDIVIYNLDANGNIVWVKQQTAYNTTGNDTQNNMCIDSQNNVFVAWQCFAGTVSGGINPGGGAIAVLKLSPTTTAPLQASAPTISSVADTSVTIAWTAPNNGGSAITGYTITVYNIDASTSTTTTAAAGATSKQITGLTNGVTYKFAIYATNALGNGTNSSQSAAAVPCNVPSKPAAPTLSAIGSQTITVNWVAPATNGGSISGYTITIYNATANTSSTTTAAAGATSKQITGLTNASSYTFTVIATNAAGNSLESSKSATGIPFTIPGVPTGVTASSGESLRSLVSWTKPANNGSAITSYTIKAITGGSTVATRVIDGEDITSGYVYGLTNGTAYTFKVAATNAAGSSSDSTASSAATPQSDAPTTAVVDAISQGSAAPITSYVTAATVTTADQKADLTIQMRTAISAASATATEQQKVEAKVAYIDAMRSKVGDTYAVPATKFTDFIKTLNTTVTETLVPKPVEVFVPPYDSTTKVATVDVSSVPNESYVHIEIPIGYSITLTNGGISVTLTFNGTNLSDGITTYTAGSSLVLGSKTFTLLGFGSVIINQENTSEVICVVEGSQILTPSGNVAVENLSKGDHVLTGDNRSLPISKIYKVVVVSATTVNAPYVIEKDAFGTNCPPNRLEVSPRHAIMIKPDLWELPMEAAKENSRVYQNKAAIGNRVIYYHFALHNYESDNVYVNGQLTETMNDGKCLENYVWNKDLGGYTRTYKPIQSAKKTA